jgi:hypothetical protein
VLFCAFIPLKEKVSIFLQNWFSLDNTETLWSTHIALRASAFKCRNTGAVHKKAGLVCEQDDKGK